MRREGVDWGGFTLLGCIRYVFVGKSGESVCALCSSFLDDIFLL